MEGSPDAIVALNNADKAEIIFPVTAETENQGSALETGRLETSKENHVCDIDSSQFCLKPFSEMGMATAY